MGTRNAPEWRFGKGWTDEALSKRLAALAATARDAASPGRPGRVGHLRRVVSTEVLARERVGVPERGGVFERACDLVAAYELSDPGIVAAHFDRRGGKGSCRRGIGHEPLDCHEIRRHRTPAPARPRSG